MREDRIRANTSDNIYILDDGNSRVVQCTYAPSNNSINFAQQWSISSGLSHHALTSADPGTFTYTENPPGGSTMFSPAVIQFDGAVSSAFNGQGVVALRFPWGVVNNSGSLIVADRDGNQLLQLDGQSGSNGILNFDTSRSRVVSIRSITSRSTRRADWRQTATLTCISRTRGTTVSSRIPIFTDWGCFPLLLLTLRPAVSRCPLPTPSP